MKENVHKKKSKSNDNPNNYDLKSLLKKRNKMQVNPSSKKVQDLFKTAFDSIDPIINNLQNQDFFNTFSTGDFIGEDGIVYINLDQINLDSSALTQDITKLSMDIINEFLDQSENNKTTKQTIKPGVIIEEIEDD